MIKKLTLAFVLSGCVSAWSFAGPERVISGIGSSLSATTTPAEFVIEQKVQNEIISNGTFAATTAWATNAINWVIGSGVATFSTNNTATTNGTMYQTFESITTGLTYRLKYTATITGPVTLTPSIGETYASSKTSSGTYIQDLYLSSTNRLNFYAVATDGATCVVDNVSLRIAPEEAYACILDMSVANTDVPVYFSFNCDGNAFTNIYAEGKAMIVVSNDAPLTVQRSDKEGAIGVRRMWYRTGAGTSTLRVNAY